MCRMSCERSEKEATLCRLGSRCGDEVLGGGAGSPLPFAGMIVVVVFLFIAS